MRVTTLAGSRHLIATACVLLLCTRAFAQGGHATLVGLVEDSLGAVVPGATVTARQVDTNQTRTTATDQRGRFVFPDLATGRHEVTVELQGFDTARLLTELSVGQAPDLKIVLSPGGVVENVRVTADATLAVETRSSTFGSLVTRSQIETQPLNRRDSRA